MHRTLFWPATQRFSTGEGSSAISEFRRLNVYRKRMDESKSRRITKLSASYRLRKWLNAPKRALRMSLWD